MMELTEKQGGLDSSSAQSLEWLVGPETFNLSDSIVFWMALDTVIDGEYRDPTPPIHAHYFNLTTSASSTAKTVGSTLKTSSTSVSTTSTGTSSESPTSSVVAKTNGKSSLDVFVLSRR